MRRALSAACFSAVCSAIGASVYYTAHIAVLTHSTNLPDVARILLNVSVFAIPIAGFWGLVLGLIGGAILV